MPSDRSCGKFEAKASALRGIARAKLSLTNIFVFKSITEPEGDLEDAALIARQANLDWESILQEITTQQDRTIQFFSFAVLNTIDVFDERHNIVGSITDRLVSYCLENALLVSLDDPKTIEDSEKSWIFLISGLMGKIGSDTL